MPLVAADAGHVIETGAHLRRSLSVPSMIRAFMIGDSLWSLGLRPRIGRLPRFRRHLNGLPVSLFVRTPYAP